MHPDFSLVLQKCASNLSLKHKQPVLFSAYVNGKIMCDTTAAGSDNSPDNTEDLVRIVSDEEDEAEADEPAHLLKHLGRQEDREDNISLCSELSVGKENAGETRPSRMQDELEEDVLDISDTHSNSSNEDMQHSPSLSSQEAHINPFALANTLRFPVPFGLPTNNAAAAVANISPFQEEFLRKSHLYAEELMKHQMQLMAAARASAFSLRSNTMAQPPQITSSPNFVHHLNPLAKIGQLSAAAAAALTAAAQQTHKPLNHTSHHAHHIMQQQQQQQHQHQQQQHHQILQPHQYPFNHDTLAKLTDLSKQQQQQQQHSPLTPNTNNHHMMSTLNQLQTQMQAHLPGLLNDNNDNLHERALKFSIDNILKADFGRTNSLDSPPQLRKSAPHKSQCHRQKLNNATTAAASHTFLTDSAEHSNQILNHNISPSTQTFSSSLATICTNSNDSSSTAVSSSYSSVNGGAADLIKSSPSQTPSLSPGFSTAAENGAANKNSSKTEESSTMATSTSATGTGSGPIVWPAWVYCTRYSDRPSSGPRVRKPKAPKSTNSTPAAAATSASVACNEKANSPSSSSSATTNEDKRPRTAFSGSQLARLKHEFNENRYLTEKRRQQLSSELGLNEAQIKIWFQNKRAKLKKSSGVKNPLALQLMAQGLYNHSTIPLTREEEELQELQEREKNNNNSNNSKNNSLQQQQAASAVSS